MTNDGQQPRETAGLPPEIRAAITGLECEIKEVRSGLRSDIVRLETWRRAIIWVVGLLFVALGGISAKLWDRVVDAPHKTPATDEFKENELPESSVEDAAAKARELQKKEDSRELRIVKRPDVILGPATLVELTKTFVNYDNENPREQSVDLVQVCNNYNWGGVCLQIEIFQSMNRPRYLKFLYTNLSADYKDGGKLDPICSEAHPIPSEQVKREGGSCWIDQRHENTRRRIKGDERKKEHAELVLSTLYLTMPKFTRCTIRITGTIDGMTKVGKDDSILDKRGVRFMEWAF